MGGHSAVSGKYGLGVDQWLEAKIVTADGRYVIANAVSNPDLFWAIRGGGGGTFGVVVEATIKAYPDVPVTAVTWFLNATKPVPNSLDQPLTYLYNQLPELHDKGISGYIENGHGSQAGSLFHTGEDAGVEKAHAIWRPILEKMQSFPGVQPYQSKTHHFSNYTSFFEAGFGTMYTMARRKRHGPMDDGKVVGAKGKVPQDSHFLGSKHLKSANIMSAFGSANGNYMVLLVSPEQKIKGEDTSVNPDWRKAIAHVFAMKVPGQSNADSIRKFAPELGAYANEAYFGEPNWQKSFWGSNYAKLSEIKTKYDANGTFWVTPGINAEQYVVQDGRVCKVTGQQRVVAPELPPVSDNVNEADWASSGGRDMSLFGRMNFIARYPPAGTLLGMN
jgi:hypothetical protein